MAPAPAGNGPGVDLKRLREACRLALAVALEGETADPPVPAPAPLVPMLRFTRLSVRAYAAIARVVDEDPAFRKRVAAAEGADEDSLGRAGWLWLHRPSGWQRDPAIAEAAPRPVPARARREDGRRKRDQAEAEARRRVKEQLTEARSQAAVARREAAALHDRIEVLEHERSQAMRTAKKLEAELAEARRDLRVAKDAAIEREHELAVARAGGEQAAVDLARLQALVRQASGAAAELQEALLGAGALLGSEAPAGPDAGPPAKHAKASKSPKSPKAAKERPGKAAKGHKGEKAARARAKGVATVRVRPLPSLPPGLFDGSPEADRHLLRSGEALLVVDGYNLARAIWSGIDPETERSRTVQLVEAVTARSKASAMVVFDGESGTVAPRASRHVRVLFSPTGVTADDEIARLLGEVPVNRPVLVVSSDRAVAADARRQGAAVMGARAFEAAARR